ncbi:MAG: 50S ribosomal protein L20 [Bacteroidales bacterium]|nr:50S ribosomal protein L20 [Bacteroidales bacterium]
MPRSVNAVASRARRKRILKEAKGYFGRRKNVWTVAKNAVEKALCYSYRDRRAKKRSFRALWIQRINAGARLHGMSYSQLIGKLAKEEILLNRKVLADLAMNHPSAFEAIVKKSKIKFL